MIGLSFAILRAPAAWLMMLLVVSGVSAPLVVAQSGTEFGGTVVTVDAAAGKLTVKKEGGGTRFTFTANDKTRFEGPGLTSLKDVKKGDRVMVTYIVTGSRYLAQKVAKK